MAARPYNLVCAGLLGVSAASTPEPCDLHYNSRNMRISSHANSYNLNTFFVLEKLLITQSLTNAELLEVISYW